MDGYLQEVYSVIKSYPTTSEEKKVLIKLNKQNSLIRILKTFKVFKLSYFINKRDAYYNLKQIEIKYSHKLKRFIVV